MHPAKNDDVLIGRRRLPAQFQRIAHKVGYAVVQGGFHVVVPQNQGVALFFELVNFIGRLRLQVQFGLAVKIAQLALEVRESLGVHSE